MTGIKNIVAIAPWIGIAGTAQPRLMILDNLRIVDGAVLSLP